MKHYRRIGPKKTKGEEWRGSVGTHTRNEKGRGSAVTDDSGSLSRRSSTSAMNVRRQQRQTASLTTYQRKAVAPHRVAGNHNRSTTGCSLPRVTYTHTHDHNKGRQHARIPPPPPTHPHENKKAAHDVQIASLENGSAHAVLETSRPVTLDSYDGHLQGPPRTIPIYERTATSPRQRQFLEDFSAGHRNRHRRHRHWR